MIVETKLCHGRSTVTGVERIFLKRKSGGSLQNTRFFIGSLPMKKPAAN
jgi:hypothetical protein